jgi:cytosine/adenosine deaminase-related metal-dependent hydrolase
MLVVRARWLLPIAERPLLNGWVAVDRGRVVAAGRAGATLPLAGDAPLVDLGPFAVLPALVNAHTHLELSWLRGLVAPAPRFTEWVPAMLQRRMHAPEAGEVLAAIERAIDEVRAGGTGVVADISNSLATVAPLRRSTLDGVVVHELLGFPAAGADDTLDAALRAQAACGPSERFPVSLAAHAPYSVSPRLFQGIRAAQARTPFLPSSVHLAESEEEGELLRSGGGPWRELLRRLNAWDDTWVAPESTPVEYLDRMGVLDSRLLAAHAVHCTDDDLRRLRERGVTVVTCPRSNAFVGAGDPPVARFFASGVRVAVGTDSLASNVDLNLFAELARMRHLAPDVPAAALLDSATRAGADALGLSDRHGTIEPGRSAALVAVALPPDVIDVEEYLVGGITPDRVRWVSDLVAECGLLYARAFARGASAGPP